MSETLVEHYEQGRIVEETHTPGPWKIMGCAGGYLIDGPHGASDRVVRGSGGVRRREDAELIALAPDLVMACEEAATYLEALISQGIPPPPLARRLRSLAARARGEAPPLEAILFG